MSNAATEVYTMEEVAKHCDKSSAWFVIANEVLDVTKFLDDHPGGRDVLLAHSGTDATEAFYGNNHSRGAIAKSKHCIIGRLAETEGRKYYHMSDIEKAKGTTTCLMCINNIVYDLNEFGDLHPGGRDVLKYQAGTDATAAFAAIGHSTRARSMMEKYAVGFLWPAERKHRVVNAPSSPDATATAGKPPVASTSSAVSRKFDPFETVLGRVLAQVGLLGFALAFLIVSYYLVL